MASKWKNSSTLLSSILKVEENKVLLFIHFMVIWQSYDNCVIWAYGRQKLNLGNRKTGPNSVILPQNEKILAHHFHQLLKLKKIKCPHFLILRSFGKVMNNLWFELMIVNNHKLLKRQNGYKSAVLPQN